MTLDLDPLGAPPSPSDHEPPPPSPANDPAAAASADRGSLDPLVAASADAAEHPAGVSDSAAAPLPPSSPADSDAPPRLPRSSAGRFPLADAAALDNARRGYWVMTDDLDGWVLLGDDGQPVRRADRSRVSFRFRDAARLAAELAPSDDMSPGASAKGDADPVPLAPLDAGYNRDWDPHALATQIDSRTKLLKLLAYRHARFSEPEEAVRRAVSDLFGDPILVEEPSIYAWVPGRYDLAAVKSAAAALQTRAAGPLPEGWDSGPVYTGIVPFGALMRGGGAQTASARAAMPRDNGGLGANLVKAAATSVQANPADGETQIAQAGALEGQIQQSQAPIPQREPAVRGDFGRPQRKPTDSPYVTIIENITPRPPAERLPAIARRLARNHIAQAWLDKLAREFETFEQPNDGYGTYQLDPKKRGRENQPEQYALGKYQMRRPSLLDTKLMARDGQATGKYGIDSWESFLNNPDAQEAAMIDWGEALEGYMHSYGHAAKIGQTITGVKDQITITEGGLIAAMHKQGAEGVRRYFQWLEKHDWNSRDHQEELKKLSEEQESAFRSIETRLRRFQDTPYRQ